LALAEYAAVAPEYAGLGVGITWDGSVTVHQYDINKLVEQTLSILRELLSMYFQSV
jgi:hypothetical protein